MIDKRIIETRFKEVFGSDADLSVKSPGRINIIGEHTDYNEGFVLPAAIDKNVYVALRTRQDGQINLYSEGYNEHYKVSLRELAPTEKGWPNYILGVVHQYVQKGVSLAGFDLYIDGDVPLGAGLSSSAAVECATGFALNELFDLGLSRVDIAKAGQLAEHTYAGVKCGIMDQFASVVSKEDHVTLLDCRNLDYEFVPFQLVDYDILLLNTNVKHNLASTAYNDRRAACEQAVAWIAEQHPQVRSLRDVDLGMLDGIVKEKSEDVYTKAKYVVEENTRVLQACEALRKNDIAELGRLLFAAHHALSKEYEVSCAELDFLVEAVEERDEVVGARMMGGGFGGCTVNIIRKGTAEKLVKDLAPEYLDTFGFDFSPIYVSISGGASKLE